MSYSLQSERTKFKKVLAKENPTLQDALEFRASIKDFKFKHKNWQHAMKVIIDKQIKRKPKYAA